MISFILVMHDLGHIIMFKLFKYQITEILVLPFGSVINTNINGNAKSSEIFLISIAGVMMQLCLYPLIKVLNVSDLSYQIFLQYNWVLMVFNLLPIIPLDGSKILLTGLETLFSYKKALKLSNLISIIMIIILTIYLTFNALNSYMIIVFLIYKTYEMIKNHEYFFQRFLLVRTLKKNEYRHIKNVASIKKIFKNRYNFINGENEEKVLNNHFKNYE